MKNRSRRPLILQKRTPLLPGSPVGEEGHSSQAEGAKQELGVAQEEEEGKSRRPATPLPPSRSAALSKAQGGVAPATPGFPSLLEALAAKPSSSQEPGKGGLANRGSAAPEEEKLAETRPWIPEDSGWGAPSILGNQEGNEEAANCGLDNSLTNIQWLGKMTPNGLSSCSIKKETEKENQTPKQKTSKSEGSPSAATISSTLWHESFSQRPPYSYMAMIQFAINSTEKKRMMLKDIYTWIEDHFPYFKHVAKPGWKNSVRHNLSLHDMFIRETSANGKIAFWTIHPEANRYLTLDQVFKQQKRPTLDLRENTKGSKVKPQTSRPRIKLLLPRVSSYLVPVQFPASEPVHPQMPSRPPLPASQAALLRTMQINRGERPAPKILRSSEELTLLPPASSIKEESYCGEQSSSLTPHQSLEEGTWPDSREPSAEVLNDSFHSQEWASSFLPVWPVKEEPAQGDEEQNFCDQVFPIKQERQITGLRSPPQSTLVIKRQELGRSRRKQHLALSSSEEPVLLLPPSSGSNSFPKGHSPPSTQEEPLGNVAHHACGPGEEGCFKTPVKEVFCKLPIASTPNKTPITTSTILPATDQWRLAPLDQERSNVDFSPLKPSPLPFLPFQDNLDLLGFNETPPRQSLCDSLQCSLLNAEAGEIVPGLLTSSPTSSKVASELPGDNSLLEGLVLDTMPDNWSKISLDVSFSDTENDNLETDLSWSQFLPQLK